MRAESMTKINVARDTLRDIAPSSRPLRGLAVAFLIATYACVSATAFLGIVRAQGKARESGLTPIQAEIERQRQRLASTEVEERRDGRVQLSPLTEGNDPLISLKKPTTKPPKLEKFRNSPTTTLCEPVRTLSPCPGKNLSSL